MSHTIIDIDGLSYQECGEKFIALFEVGHLTGHTVTKNDGDAVADDAIEDLVQTMVKTGWSVETARKCRNSAASRAFRKSGPMRVLEQLRNRPTAHIVGKN